MGRGEPQLSQWLILVAVLGSTSTRHKGDQAALPQQGATVPRMGLDRPAGTVCPQLRCRLDGEGEERFSLKYHGWQASLYAVGPLESVMVSVCELCTVFCHMDHGHWMSLRFGGLVVGQVTVGHLYHHSLRYWIPSVVAYLPCWFTVSSLRRHLAFKLSKSHVQRCMSGCLC